ncbi:MAG: hypothetical protein KF788_22700 [Piscinibacter sp.]|nr:hypothetical protein [Piscinibacter sp.]
MNHARRRLLAAAGLAVAGCAGDPVVSNAPDAPHGASAAGALATPWRSVAGGFLAPAAPPFGLPARPGSGAFVKWVAPAAIALRASDLLVADLAGGRLWRADLGALSVSAVAGAPVGPGSALALGPDLSAWVLDVAARQVLRFARDGRLLQTFRAGTPTPGALALADGGATLLVADAGLAQWVELRSAGAVVPTALPARDGQRISGTDALAVSRTAVWVLDRAAARVHRVARDGRVLASLGEGTLRQPFALAVDRDERVFVADTQGPALHVLQVGAAPQTLDAAALGVQQIGGLAIDERVLAVSDRLLGQVQLFTLRPGGPA